MGKSIRYDAPLRGVPIVPIVQSHSTSFSFPVSKTKSRECSPFSPKNKDEITEGKQFIFPDTFSVFCSSHS